MAIPRTETRQPTQPAKNKPAMPDRVGKSDKTDKDELREDQLKDVTGGGIIHPL
jgi:hypothetical protein